MKSVGIYGGTFDPVHFGHLLTAQSLFEKRDLEKIIFIPCSISPHKQDIISSNPLHRLNMLKLAVKDIPYFEISNYEIQKGSISYTIDTLRHLSDFYENIELIIGYDNLAVFDKWYKADEILEIAKLVVMKRVSDFDTNQNHKYFDKAVIVDTPTIEISSTEIRNRVNQGLSINFMMPEKVSDYIYKNGIYR